MKYFVLCLVAILVFAVSCTKDAGIELNVESLVNNLRPPTQEEMMNLEPLSQKELIELAKKGISLSLEKRNTCEWSDRRFGSIECNGGRCSVARYRVNGARYVSLVCHRGGGPSHAGAFRPI